jgi:hypothetical protein
MKNKNLTNEIMLIIEEIGYLTGSKKFGLANEDSDWDYVVLFHEFKRKMNQQRINFLFNNPSQGENIPSCIITDMDIYNEKGLFRSYRISDDSYEFNLIMVWSQKELEVWQESTKILQLLPLYLIKDKKNRVSLFEAIKKTVRNIIQENKND